MFDGAWKRMVKDCTAKYIVQADWQGGGRMVIEGCNYLK